MRTGRERGVGPTGGGTIGRGDKEKWEGEMSEHRNSADNEIGARESGVVYETCVALYVHSMSGIVSLSSSYRAIQVVERFQVIIVVLVTEVSK